MPHPQFDLDFAPDVESVYVVFTAHRGCACSPPDHLAG
jgi:hypothetical protein